MIEGGGRKCVAQRRVCQVIYPGTATLGSKRTGVLDAATRPQ